MFSVPSSNSTLLTSHDSTISHSSSLLIARFSLAPLIASPSLYSLQGPGFYRSMTTSNENNEMIHSEQADAQPRESEFEISPLSPLRTAAAYEKSVVGPFPSPSLLVICCQFSIIIDDCMRPGGPKKVVGGAVCIRLCLAASVVVEVEVTMVWSSHATYGAQKDHERWLAMATVAGCTLRDEKRGCGDIRLEF